MNEDAVIISFNREQLTREMHVSNFIGAYSFWQTISPRIEDPEGRDFAEATLRRLAGLAFGARHGRAESPLEDEAFRYCGMEVRGK